jgi:hypothetical protein
MNKKQYIWSCGSNPFETIEELSKIITNARQINKQTFFRNCDFIPMDYVNNKKQFTLYPRDFKFYKNKNIYFYIHSAIEYFYT